MKRIQEFFVSLIFSLIFSGVWYVFSVSLFVPQNIAFVLAALIFIVSMLEFLRG